MSEVFKRLRQVMASRRRRRALLTIRREFAKCGYPLDRLGDAEIEASLPPETFDDPASRLGAKAISRALLRMPHGVSARREGARYVRT